jgi:hypothetical protein
MHVNAFVVFFVLPILIGGGAKLLVHSIRGASFAAAVAAPVSAFLCIRAFDPEDAWTWLAALLVSPLVMALAVITVLLCHRRARAAKRSAWLVA